MTDAAMLARAEQLGAMAREFGDPRDSNSYVELRKPGGPDELVDGLVAAWYRGWDRADAALASGKRPTL
jgi:hypothetical protein